MRGGRFTGLLALLLAACGSTPTPSPTASPTPQSTTAIRGTTSTGDEYTLGLVDDTGWLASGDAAYEPNRRWVAEAVWARDLVVNGANDHVLVVAWTGSVCPQPRSIILRADADRLRIILNPGKLLVAPSGQACPAMAVAYAVRLELDRAGDASSVMLEVLPT